MKTLQCPNCGSPDVRPAGYPEYRCAHCGTTVIPDQGLTGFVDVVLVQSPPGKNAIQVIQALRQATDLGLTEAKAAVENLPTVICRSVKAADGERIRAALEKVGGKAVLKAA